VARFWLPLFSDQTATTICDNLQQFSFLNRLKPMTLTASPPPQPRFPPADSILDGDQSRFPIARLFEYVSFAAALSVIGLLFWLSWVIFQQALPAIGQFGLGFLVSRTWNSNELIFGALPYIYGSLVSAIGALLLAVPIGLAIAIITSEKFLPKSVQAPIVFLVEMIASIPSVIVGFWGMFVLIPALEPVQLWLYKHFGWVPFFSTETAGFSMFVAIVILAVMILPTIAAISRDVLLAFPAEMRSAAIGLGATRWEMILTVLLPSSLSGIVGAVMLALGRALGETMAVTMVIGNGDELNISLFDTGNTIPSMLTNQFGEAQDALHVGSLMYLALILFLLTLLVNVGATYLVKLLAFKDQA
jgi:phosphate transport system permease protein